MDIRGERNAFVASTIGKIRHMEAAQGVNRFAHYS